MTADSAGAWPCPTPSRTPRARPRRAGHQHRAAGHAAVHRQRGDVLRRPVRRLLQRPRCRLAGQSWPPPGTRERHRAGHRAVIVATIILIAQLVHHAVRPATHRKGDRTGMNRALAVTLVHGRRLPGAAGIRLLRPARATHGFGINSGIYGTLFYTMTGFHGAHVFGGVVGIGIILLRGIARPVLGQAPRRGRGGQRLLALRRHRVDLPVLDALLAEVGAERCSSGATR